LQKRRDLAGLANKCSYQLCLENRTRNSQFKPFLCSLEMHVMPTYIRLLGLERNQHKLLEDNFFFKRINAWSPKQGNGTLAKTSFVMDIKASTTAIVSRTPSLN
jgi:hypothetical protein